MNIQEILTLLAILAGCGLSSLLFAGWLLWMLVSVSAGAAMGDAVKNNPAPGPGDE